ncbi:MAG: hypothetical protein AAFX55_13990 [Bacteroidota bacterium]
MDHPNATYRYVGYVAEVYGFGSQYPIPYLFDGIFFIDNANSAEKDIKN